VSKRAKSGIGFWVTCIAAVLFAIAIGASFPWGYVIVAVAAAVVAFQMGRKVGKDPVWTLFTNMQREKPGRSSSRNLIASARTRSRPAPRQSGLEDRKSHR
jgi:hypothetical protein